MVQGTGRVAPSSVVTTSRHPARGVTPDTTTADLVHAVADRLEQAPPAGTGSLIDQHPGAVPTQITHELSIVGEPAEALWESYVANFDPLADLAILQHNDAHDEFLAQLENPRIVKIVGWQSARPVGLAMVTNHLESVTEISPRFLRTKYPEHAAKNRIYVGMLVMVSQSLRGRTLFGRLYTELWQVPALAGGVLIFDVCEFNRTMFDTDRLTERIASTFPRSSVEVVDRQTWYAAELPEPLPGTRPT